MTIGHEKALMRYLCRLLVLTVVLGFASTSWGQPPSPDSLRNGPKVLQAFREVVAKPREHTVRILADSREVAYGTIVEADGLILTKASELHGKITCRLADGKVLEAKIIASHDPFDLALLKVEAADLPTAQWRAGKEVKVGQWVASVGTGTEPMGVGFVSVATRKFKLGDQPPKFFNPKAGWLGVLLDDAPQGAKIKQVVPGSPAQKASLKDNDIVIEAAGRKIDSFPVLIATIQRFKNGDMVSLKIKRNGEDLELVATLGKAPPQVLGNPQETMGTTLSKRRGEFPAILQHDTGLKPEDCGGPLVDLDGKTVAINISRSGRTETFAIPAEEVQAVLADLKSGKLVPPVLADVEKSPKDPALVLRWASKLTEKDQASKYQEGAFMKVQEMYLATGVTYEIELKSTAFGPHLSLENAAGKKLAEIGDQNAKIVFSAKSEGTYRIVASALQPKDVGDFTVVVRKQTAVTKEKDS
jgi:serine protease Do